MIAKHTGPPQNMAANCLSWIEMIHRLYTFFFLRKAKNHQNDTTSQKAFFGCRIFIKQQRVIFSTPYREIIQPATPVRNIPERNTRNYFFIFPE
jgi:hypothetical protein